MKSSTPLLARAINKAQKIRSSKVLNHLQETFNRILQELSRLATLIRSRITTTLKALACEDNNY